MPLLRADDGVELYHQRLGPAAGRPVVLHHGFGADGRLDWVETGVAQALVAAGRRVVLPDARGHGRSGKPHDPDRYGEDRMARDVSLLLDTLGPGPVDLAGYSMGGIVALRAAARDPRVRRLAVGGIGAAVVERGGVDTGVLPPEVLRAALLADRPEAVAHPVAAGFRAFTERPGVDRVALAAHVSVLHRDPVPLDRVTVPALVLAGRDDELATRPEVLAAALPGARLELVDGDHGSALRAPRLAQGLVEFFGA